MYTVKYRWFVVKSICVLILWFVLLYTFNQYYSSTYKNVKQLLQYRILESTNELHNDTLADLDNFEYVFNNDSLCMKSTSTEIIIIMVHTARDNFDHRYAIRKLYKQWHLHLIFLLGIDAQSDPESYTNSRILEENNDFGDIVMGNFVDTYANLTYKHLMGYKWISTFCPTAKYILKTDDDIFADIFQIIDVLLEQLKNSRNTYVCENLGGNRPIRQIDHKWYCPEEIWPEELYPNYCSGSAYLMKADDALKIYSISNTTKLFGVDDVFVTGILRSKYNVVVNNRTDSSLDVLWFGYSLIYMGEKTEIINWCSKDLSINQLKNMFVLLTEDNEFIRDMFCIWNKVRLTRYAMNIGLDLKSNDP